MSRVTAFVLAISLCAVAVAGCGGGSGKKIEGQGPTVTLPIKMSDNWQVEYQFTGQFMRVTVTDDFGERAGTISQQGSGRGVSRFPKGGTFTMEVQTEQTGMWVLDISHAP